MENRNEGLSFRQMVGSVLASFFGVQSSKNRNRDFGQGKAKDFILVGILMTSVWYGAIYLVVTVLLSNR
jgi:hypothetical protein